MSCQTASRRGSIMMWLCRVLLWWERVTLPIIYHRTSTARLCRRCQADGYGNSPVWKGMLAGRLISPMGNLKESCSCGAALRAWMQQKLACYRTDRVTSRDNRSSSRPPLHEAGFHLLMSKPPIFQPLITAALRAACVSSASHHHRGLGLLPLL